MKRYIWGFPGIGKSSLNIPGVKIVDADCKKFEFKDVADDELHRKSDNLRYYELDESYPQNYLDYIQSVDADVVLINCHLSLLEQLDKENVLIVYPNRSMVAKYEYLSRYSARGDNDSFIEYMSQEWENIIRYIEESNFDKYKILGVDKTLSNLFERNDFKMKLMVWSELAELLQRAKDLNVLGLEEDGRTLVCDKKFLGDSSLSGVAAGTLADDVFKGKYSLDIDQLIVICDEREKQIQQEKVFLERRGGLSREELADKIMQGIVNGALGIRYAEIAPYSHGYEVTYGPGEHGSTRDCKNRWECYCDFFEIPAKIVEKIENNKQDTPWRGRCEELDIEELIGSVDNLEKNKLKSFIPEKDSGFERRSRYTGHVASVMDVHKGLALDGIVQGHFAGDYSSMTPSTQNRTVKMLVYMKGFCLDCLCNLDASNVDKHKIIEYLGKHGNDISTPEKLQEWIKANPMKCGIEYNRRTSLTSQIANSIAKVSVSQDIPQKDLDVER